MYDHLPTAVWDESLAEPGGGRAAAVAAIPPTDGERLMRFCRHRDQSAFAEVVEAHAAMVWGVCSQILRHHQDVEDAFQATFLILARKAKAIRAADSAAGWLYRVAFRTALLARHRRHRRSESPLVTEPLSIVDQLAAVERSEQCLTLLEELHSLPAQYREPLVLCYLEGRSRTQAAEELGVTSQTVKGRLARGTRLLRSRLARRGVALSATMGVVSASMATSHAAMATPLASATTSLAAAFAWKLGDAAQTTAAAKAAACSLAEKGLLAMSLAAAAKPAVGILAVCLAAGSIAIASADGTATITASNGAQFVAVLDDGANEGADEVNTVELQANEITVEQPAKMDETATEADEEAPSAEARADAAPATATITASAASVSPPAVAGDVLMDAPYGAATPEPVRVPLTVETRAPGVAAPFIEQAKHVALLDAQRHSVGTASMETLKLETEYWDLKANGLRKKAEALMMKARQARDLQATGALSSSDTSPLEAEAEADLTLAEVKLCEVNAHRVKDEMAAREKFEKDKAEGKLSDVLMKRFDVRNEFQYVPAIAPHTGEPAAAGGAWTAPVAPPAAPPAPPTPPQIRVRAAAPKEVQAAVKARAKEIERAAQQAKAIAIEIEAGAREAAAQAQAAASDANRELVKQLAKLQAEKAQLQQELQQLQQQREKSDSR